MTGSTADCLSPARRLAVKAWLVRGACRWLLAAVFLMAGASKVTGLAAFADVVLLHSPAPFYLGVVAAAWLPWLELTCGLCLAVGYAVREAAGILAVLLFALLVYSLAYPGDADACGCFVFPIKVEALPSWWPPVRNAFLLLASLWLSLPEQFAFIRKPKQSGLDAVSIPPERGASAP
jgi:uncharacterized membrane protein YphA (DoxX/SURF4 family)